MSRLLVVAFALCVTCIFGDTVTDDMYNIRWTYNDTDTAKNLGLLPPSRWKNNFGACDANMASAHQSPIDIDHTKVPLSNSGVLPLEFQDDACAAKVGNIGWTLSAMPYSPSACKAGFKTASGTTYKFYEAHLHWHQYYNHRGSEHKVDGQAEAVEAQLVHYNAKFKTIQDAFDDANVGNIAVVSIRYTVAPTQDTPTETLAFNSFIAQTYPNLRYMNTTFTMKVDPFNPYDLIGNALPRTNLPMYHYNGSLTTPRCDSIVSWYIVQQTVMLSQSQLHQLRFFSHLNETEAKKGKLGFENTCNCRPVAPLHGRDVVAWPTIIEPNMSSDSAPDDSALELWELALIIGGCAVVALVVIIIIVVVAVKNRRRNDYVSIINSSN